MRYFIYRESGEILHVYCGSNPELQGQLYTLAESGESSQYYVIDGVAQLKPEQLTAIDKFTLIADGIDMIAIINAPTGMFTATNTTTKETVTGLISGNDSFSTTIPGTYKINIKAWPYLDFESTIEAI